MPAALPDFRNLGVWLRTLVGVNLLSLLWLLARYADPARLGEQFLLISVWIEPSLLFVLLLLHSLAFRLNQLVPRVALVLVVLLSVVVAVIETALIGGVLGQVLSWSNNFAAAGWAALAAVMMLAYFSWRSAVYSPALAEARLMALTARIRPHFLYNSLNAVLGVIRHDPRRAEAALEELADLFRALMKENRDLVPLSEEIALARQYLELERLRLGERLQVVWQVDACPPDTLLPPLMLQPLLENAVYHGIEPAQGPGVITLNLGLQNERIRLAMSNPRHSGEHGHGNQMALANIRERLMLFFDLEARLETRERDGLFEVIIEWPLRRKGGK